VKLRRRKCGSPMSVNSPAKRRQRKADLLRRVREPTEKALLFCSVPSCTRLPQARAGNGLSPTVCEFHRAFRNRHGCAWKRSSSGPQLRPYVRAAESYLKVHADNVLVRHALDQVQRLLESAGPVRAIGDLARLAPKRKAEAALARLRQGEVPPPRIVAVTIGVLAAVLEDTVKPGGDYPLVQIAKALRRRASGFHVVYGPGSCFDKYPRSSGRVLVALGTVVLGACEHLARDYVSAVLELKKERYGPAPASTGPLPSPRSKFGNERVRPPPAVPPASTSSSAPNSAELDAKELDRLAKELSADFRRQGMKAFDGKF